MGFGGPWRSPPSLLTGRFFNEINLGRLGLSGAIAGDEAISPLVRLAAAVRLKGKHMRVWGKVGSGRREVRGVACALMAGASRQELLNEAVGALLAEGNAERVGVWLEANEELALDRQPFLPLRGSVADADGSAVPGEWSKLSLGAPLPSELLLALKTVEQELGDSSRDPVIGAMVGMRHLLWVPVAAEGRLRGVILAGARKKHAALPKTLAATVAAELALAL